MRFTLNQPKDPNVDKATYVETTLLEAKLKHQTQASSYICWIIKVINLLRDEMNGHKNQLKCHKNFKVYFSVSFFFVPKALESRQIAILS